MQAYAAGAFESLNALAASSGFALTGTTACDFGCGTGLLTERLADRCARVDAVDTSPAMRAVLDAKIERRGWTRVRTLEWLPSTPLFRREPRRDARRLTTRLCARPRT
ncbi:MAG TPA: methyltransferase domain-containing protein [Acidimicrobiia bacterium]|nr:methyltransferase domain-containing protein [Acidimicrobiia bacterium]